MPGIGRVTTGRERRWALGGPGGGLPPARGDDACLPERANPSSDATCFLLLAALLLEAVVYFSLCHAHDMLVFRSQLELPAIHLRLRDGVNVECGNP